MPGVVTGTYAGTLYLTANPTTITNTALIEGVSGIGVNGTVGTAWTLDNQGVILPASFYSVLLQSGGLVINEVGARIGGVIHIDGSAGTAAGTVVNDGSIAHVFRAEWRHGHQRLRRQPVRHRHRRQRLRRAAHGIQCRQVHRHWILELRRRYQPERGGYVSNAATGTLTAGGNAIVANTVAASVYNAGFITAASGAGVYLHGSGSVTNATGGTITGGIFGVRVLNGTGTVDNDGIINATSIGPFANSVMGVNLRGGTLINQAAGTIAGYNDGAYVGAGGGVTNQGTITATHGNGVYLTAGGVLTNTSGGAISGFSRGVLAKTGALTATNQGRIVGSTGDGIELHSGGAITNTTGGSIIGGGAGSESGIYIYGGNGAVFNQGVIAETSTFGLGVELHDGGSVTNAAGGTISGGNAAIYAHGIAAVTVSNAGTIEAASASGVAIQFSGDLANRLIDQPGAVFVGTVSAGAYPNPSRYPVSTLELTSAATFGTISSIGGQFAYFGQVSVDSGAYWVMAGTNALAATSTLTNQGTLKLTAATFTDPGVLVNNGIIDIDPSTMMLSNLTGAGSVTIGAASTLVAKGTVAASESRFRRHRSAPGDRQPRQFRRHHRRLWPQREYQLRNRNHDQWRNDPDRQHVAALRHRRWHHRPAA